MLMTKRKPATIGETPVEEFILTSLRDTLLSKLISGELRIKAAEKIVEAVA